mmetsp:Transcript_39287/g.113617  ORF Transcript_39287/g.113617 Transcript_39287/m.113617 type:complete len:285 (-) Transcript_39287:360-1214(-)
MWEGGMQGINYWFADCAPVRQAAEKCGVQPWVVVCAGFVWLLGFALWGYTGELICTVVGSVYPMYASFRALEDGEHEEASQWLTYWITVVAVMLAEHVVYRLFCWVPFYHIMRLLFVLWLFLPFTRGAATTYSWLVGPLLRRHRPAVDVALNRCFEEMRSTLAGKRNEEMRRAFRSAADVVRSASPGRRGSGGKGSQEAPATPLSRDIGLHDYMAQELAREAAFRLGQAATSAVGASLRRHRAASPGATVRAHPPPPPCAEEQEAPLPQQGVPPPPPQDVGVAF